MAHGPRAPGSRLGIPRSRGPGSGRCRASVPAHGLGRRSSGSSPTPDGDCDWIGHRDCKPNGEPNWKTERIPNGDLRHHWHTNVSDPGNRIPDPATNRLEHSDSDRSAANDGTAARCSNVGTPCSSDDATSDSHANFYGGSPPNRPTDPDERSHPYEHVHARPNEHIHAHPNKHSKPFTHTSPSHSNPNAHCPTPG